jgi:GalNAc-alpha-(1->4)-GalNAc-alpha-(1->3)-diNAcBac-PP-undecaprenol alpha-1,4-N-acetyl-D-galactosaminyltransferase
MIITNRMGPNLFLGNFIETMNKIFYRFADELIVQTERAKDILSKKYKVKKITVIPNPVESTTFDRAIKKKQIISVGRLSSEKGHQVLLKAFAHLQDKEWTLHLVGDGKERESLEILSKELQIDDRVVFHGKMHSFVNLLLESQIFVLPSFYEGFPNALLEAMSVGLCCVASDCISGPSDIIANGSNGLLFEPGNDIQLAELLNELIADKHLINKLSNEAMLSLDRFEKEAIFNQFEKSLFQN